MHSRSGDSVRCERWLPSAVGLPAPRQRDRLARVLRAELYVSSRTGCRVGGTHTKLLCVCDRGRRRVRLRTAREFAARDRSHCRTCARRNSARRACDIDGSRSLRSTLLSGRETFASCAKRARTPPRAPRTRRTHTCTCAAVLCPRSPVRFVRRVPTIARSHHDPLATRARRPLGGRAAAQAPIFLPRPPHKPPTTTTTKTHDVDSH